MEKQKHGRVLQLSRVFKENNRQKAELKKKKIGQKEKRKIEKQFLELAKGFGELKRKNGLSVHQKK